MTLALEGCRLLTVLGSSGWMGGGGGWGYWGTKCLSGSFRQFGHSRLLLLPSLVCWLDGPQCEGRGVVTGSISLGLTKCWRCIAERSRSVFSLKLTVVRLLEA